MHAHTHRFSVVSNRRSNWRNEQLLGKTFLDHQQEIVLKIGTDAWTREELVTQLKCANVNAARLLTKAAEKLQVENARQMAARVTLEDLFALRSVGITTVYVWLCVLDSGHYVNPIKWIDRKDDNIVTLSTEKLRVKRAQEAAQAEAATVAKDARRVTRAPRRTGTTQ